MSGLNRFVGQDQRVGTSSAPLKVNRSSIASFSKITAKDRRPAKSSAPRQPTPIQNDTYPTAPDTQNGYTQAHYDQAATAGGERDMFDETIHTDTFEKTISDLGDVAGGNMHMNGPMFTNNNNYHNERGYSQERNGQLPQQYEDEEDTYHGDINVDAYNPAPAQPLNHKESQRRLKFDQEPVPRHHTPGIAGRFAQPLQHRTASPDVPEAEVVRSKSARKRKPSHEPSHSHQKVVQYQQDQAFDLPMDHGAPVKENMNGYAYADQPVQNQRTQILHLQELQQPAEENYAPESPHLEDPNRAPQSQTQDVPAVVVDFSGDGKSDYKDGELKRKTFKDLRSEDWGANMTAFDLPEKIAGEDITLKAKIMYYKAENMSEKDQVAFFEHMDDEEWQAAGEFIKAKKQELMDNIQYVRDEKRRIAAKYEKMFEDRDAAIKKRIADLDVEMDGMEQDGNEILEKRYKNAKKGKKSKRGVSEASSSRR